MDMIGQPLKNNEMIGLYIEPSAQGSDFKDISIDFIDEKIWGQIAKRARYNKESNQYYFPSSSGNIYVDLPDDLYFQRKVIPVSAIPPRREKFNLKIEQPNIYSLISFIEMFERYLDGGDFNTISTNEIDSIQVYKNCTYICFHHSDMRNDFCHFIGQKRDHNAVLVNTQAIVEAKSIFEEDPKRKIQERLTKNATSEKYVDKMDMRERSRRDEEMKGNQSKRNSSGPEIEYKTNRKEAGNARFVQGTSKDDHRIKQVEAEANSRDKFAQERPVEKRKMDKADEARKDEPKKKIPRKYKFTIESYQTRKMFRMIGTGDYTIYLQEN